MISFDAKHAEYEDLFEPEGYLQSCYGLGPGYGKKPRELSDINREVRFKMTTTPRYLDQCLMHKGDQLSYVELSVGPYVYNMTHAASKEQIAHIDCTDFCSNNLQYLEKVGGESFVVRSFVVLIRINSVHEQISFELFNNLSIK